MGTMPTQGASMKPLTSTRFLATAALALGALDAVTAAQPRSDVFLFIGMQSKAGT